MSQAGDELASDTVSSDPQKSADPYKASYSDPVRKEFSLTIKSFLCIPEASSRFPKSCSDVTDCERLKVQD